MAVWVALHLMEHSMAERLTELEARKAEAREAGGEIAIERHHAKGKMTARERIEYLLDEDTLPRTGHVESSRRLRHGPRGHPSLHRRRDHRLRQDRRAQGLRLLPGLHRLRRRARRDPRREDPQDHGPGRRPWACRSSDSTTARVRGSRRAWPRSTPTAASSCATRARSGVVPQISVILGPCAGRRRLLAGADRLHLHGEGLQPHVHHRSRRREDRDRRGRDARRARRRAHPRDEVGRREVRDARREELLDEVRYLLSSCRRTTWRSRRES